MKDQPKSFYTTFDSDREDIANSNKGFDKVVVNFVGIETLYSKCYSFFLSKSKMHKHITIGCLKEALPFFSTWLLLSISIIAFMAIYQSFGSGLVFKGWTYAITAITLDSYCLPQNSDPKLMVCLDTDSGVTFIDKN